MMKRNLFNILMLGVLVLALIGVASAASPSGASLTFLRSSSGLNDSAGTNNAYAGNVTEILLFGKSNTQAWQGYFGNVSGTIQLADASNNVMYNWSLARPTGEVYASTNQTITWSGVQCLNFTANGTLVTTGEVAGGTSLAGINMTTLESQYSINETDSDGVNETFTLIGAGTHDTFYTASLQFAEGECRNTRVFSGTGLGVNNQYEEVLLYEPNTKSVIFASLLENTNIAGFDSNNYGFEMLVLEDGHGSNVAVTPYYFFVELS